MIAILIAIFGKKFTAADSEGFEFKSKTPMPTWSGKTDRGNRRFCIRTLCIDLPFVAVMTIDECCCLVLGSE